MVAVYAIKSYDNKPTIAEELKDFPLQVASKLDSYKSESNTQLLKTFSNFWSSAAITDADRALIVKTTSGFEKRNLTPEPYLTSYLKSVMAFYDSSSVVRGFNEWNKAVLSIVEKRKLPKEIVQSVFEAPAKLKESKTILSNDYIKWLLFDKEITFRYDTTLYIKLSKSRLAYVADRDTVSIYGTTGEIQPFAAQYVGVGGRVFWKKAGYDTTKVYADLKKVKLHLFRSKHELDSVSFHYTDIFKNPLKGNLTISPNNVSNKELVYYPHFYSYNKNISLPNLYDSVNFDGGIAIKGSLLLGYGTKQEPAVMTFIKTKKPFITATSTSFIIRSTGFSSNGANITLRLLKDSITHNNKILDFDSKTRELRLTSDNKELLTRAPYLDSYHKIGIYSEQLYWNLNSGEIYFNAPYRSSESEALFESFSFFNQDMFDDLMRRDDQHPVYQIRKYEKSVKKGTAPLTCDGFARFLKRSNAETDILLKEMGFLGYVVYDSESKLFTTTPKLHEAIKARNGTKDYDAILFNSENQKNKNNAVLDLSTFDLTIFGIPQINLSDTQNVKVYPKNNSIILKKNRDMEFDGEVRAGLVTFKGDGFKFDYDAFSINMDKVVSMNFDYKTSNQDNTGSRILSSITSTMENITGSLRIDDPDNKSGLKRRPHYPKFQSKKDSYIYYDDPSIFGGIYKRDSFYFKVYPYEIDSLNTFEKESLGFKGQLYSSDIFAPFEETLVVQPDQSLGFSRKVDSLGVTLYKSKGKFYSTIKLSNKGLIGDGAIRYLTSLSKSDAFYFFPDSCVSYVKHLNIDRALVGIEFPNGNATNHLMKWRPYKNRMDYFKDETPFMLYDNQVALKGNLVLEPLGLTGGGMLDVSTATLGSKNFEFAAYTFKGDPSNIVLYDTKREAKLFLSDSLTCGIDLKSYKGTFSKKGEAFKSVYPDLAYISYSKKIGWDMNAQLLAISSDTSSVSRELANRYSLAYENAIPKGSLFVATTKEQDSLSFATPQSTYSMGEKLLTAQRVKHILAADAALILNPKRDTVFVSTNGAMHRIYAADLFAEREAKKHHFYNVDINIGGRKGFLGQGLYSYIDKYGKVDTITFSTITVDRDYKTVAFASIGEEDKFYLSPYFMFKGKVTAYSDKKHLTFDGGAKLTHKYESLARNWIRFTSEIAPDSVMIPISLPYQSVDKITVYAGTYLRKDSLGVYPTFFSGRKYTQDSAYVKPEGYLYYNDNGQFYQLSALDKIRKPNVAGDMISLYSDFDILVNEGKLNLGVETGEVNVVTAGKAVQKVESKDLTFTGMMTLDFLFNNESLNVMAADITAGSNVAVDYNKPNVVHALRELLGDKQSAALLTAYAKTPILEKIPPEYQHTLVLTDLQLRWDKKSRSYISVGDIGVANIGTKQVNKKVKGFIELMPNKDQRMYIYLVLDNGKTYTFAYTSAGNMFASATNENFNIPIDKTSSKKRSIKQGLWFTSYIYTNATDGMVDKVAARYKQVKAQSALGN